MSVVKLEKKDKSESERKIPTISIQLVLNSNPFWANSGACLIHGLARVKHLKVRYPLKKSRRFPKSIQKHKLHEFRTVIRIDELIPLNSAFYYLIAFFIFKLYGKTLEKSVKII